MRFCEVEIFRREEAEADLSDDVTASCYDHQITTQVLSCIKFDALCVYQLICLEIHREVSSIPTQSSAEDLLVADVLTTVL